jgi:hypothetical protein
MQSAFSDPGKVVVRARSRGWLAKFFTFPPDGRSGLRRLRWFRITFALVGAIILFYLTAVAFWLGLLRYREVHEASFVDVLLPARWPRVRVAEGTQLIAQGFQLLRTKSGVNASIYLQRGLEMNPAHRAGRLLVAQFQLETGQLNDAQQTLLDGLRFHRREPAYVLQVFRFLLQYQKDDRAVALAREILRDPTAATDDCKRVAALAGAKACFFRGNYDASDDFLRAMAQVARSSEARLIRANNDWERGYRELALVELRALADVSPSEPECHAELLQRLREIGALDEARRRTLAFQIARPELPGPRIALLHAYQESGNAIGVSREVDALLRDFATDSAALLGVADFAANTGNPALALRLFEHAKTHQLPWEPHAVLHVEALVVAQQYREALARIRALPQEHSEFAQRYGAVLDGLQAVAHHALGDVDNARLCVRTFLDRGRHRADNLVALANRFTALEGNEHAHTILLHAVRVDPLNQAALTRLVELNLNLNRIDELPGQLTALVKMRKPSPDVLRVAHYKLGSDLFLFSPERDQALAVVRRALESPVAALSN